MHLGRNNFNKRLNYTVVSGKLFYNIKYLVRVINDVPLRDHITPHYVNLGLIKLPDTIKLNTCQLIYDHFVDKNRLISRCPWYLSNIIMTQEVHPCNT